MTKHAAPVLDDQELWIAFRKGDENAFGLIAKKYYRSLFTYGTKFSRDREFIKDCIQDLYFELWNKRATIGDTDFVKFYLLKSIRRKIYRESIKNNWIDAEVDIDFMEEIDWNPSVEQQLIDTESSQEQIQILHDRLKLLSKRQQEVIYLKFYENINNETIAGVMSISKQAVANLLYRSIKELKKLI